MVKSAGPNYRRLYDPRGYRGMPKRMRMNLKSKEIKRVKEVFCFIKIITVAMSCCSGLREIHG